MDVMKKIIILSTISLFLMLRASGGDITDDIINAFKSGNAATIAKYFNATIELTLHNKEDIYSKTQAERILKDFFSQHPPSKFTLLHQGGKESSKYAIGNLTAGNKNYRITFLLKSMNNKVFIHQLRIEDTNVE